jgi:hypothetical protein
MDTHPEPLTSTIIDFISNWWPIIVAFGAFVVTIVINVKYRIPDIARRLGLLEEKVQADETQALQFIIEDDCKMKQEECRTNVCLKIDDIKVVSKGIRDEITELGKNFTKVDKQLAVMSQEIKYVANNADKHESSVLAREIIKQLKDQKKGIE